jgi:cytochrome c peroxidase
MSCHNMPNVFGNRDHGMGDPLALPPMYGHTFDIGVAQRNFHHLEFRRYDVATGTRVPIVLPLVRADGTTVDVTVVDDVGAAAATGRYEDLHRFKVPQLRRVSRLGPYFHDNSAATLEAAVDYFLSDSYRNSVDGSRHPITMTSAERQALLAFLRIL